MPEFSPRAAIVALVHEAGRAAIPSPGGARTAVQGGTLHQRDDLHADGPVRIDVAIDGRQLDTIVFDKPDNRTVELNVPDGSLPPAARHT